MSIPQSVQRQAEEADRLLEQYSAQQTLQTEPTGEPEEPAEPPTLEEPVEEPKAPTPPARNEDEASLWKQRYETLQGKYNAEVGRVAQQNRELQTQLQQVSAQVADLLKTRQPESDPKPDQTLVRPEDAENYGSDMVDFVRRVAQDTLRAREAELGKVISELRDENAKLKESLVGVEQRQGQTAQEQFISRFAQLVPDWEAINQDPAFLNWLEQTDSLTGQPRQVLLDAAHNALNAQRVAAFFNAFKQEIGRVAPSPTPTHQPTPQQPARRSAPPEVARQVQPGRSKAASTPQASEPATKIWSQREISDFYRNATQGRYSREEQARIEAEIDLAAAQGRVGP